MMDKKILKGISIGTTVLSAIIAVAGNVVGAKLQDQELEEKVLKVVEQKVK